VRAFTLVLVGLLLLIQYPLWLGKGGWLRVWELDRQVVAQHQANQRLKVRNQALEGEVRDLRQGLLAIEERARYELGMIRPDEIFVQIGDAAGISPQGAATRPGELPEPPVARAVPTAPTAAVSAATGTRGPADR